MNAGEFREGGRVKPALDRSRLPSVLQYFKRQDMHLRGRGAWRSARCPFHDDRHPSLRVNVDSGGYRCMGCGAKGGSIVAFHQAYYGLSFAAAVRDLEAS